MNRMNLVKYGKVLLQAQQKRLLAEAFW